MDGPTQVPKSMYVVSGLMYCRNVLYVAGSKRGGTEDKGAGPAFAPFFGEWKILRSSI